MRFGRNEIQGFQRTNTIKRSMCRCEFKARCVVGNTGQDDRQLDDLLAVSQPQQRDIVVGIDLMKVCTAQQRLIAEIDLNQFERAI